jgi:hypothetical protein
LKPACIRRFVVRAPPQIPPVTRRSRQFGNWPDRASHWKRSLIPGRRVLERSPHRQPRSRRWLSWLRLLRRSCARQPAAVANRRAGCNPAPHLHAHRRGGPD